METVSDFIFLVSKITADGDCSHEIKRCLLLGRKVMTNLDSILKSRDITLPKSNRQSELMDCSSPGSPVHNQLSEFAQAQVHRVGDTIQPSHPLSSPSPPAPNPSQHQGLFQWVNSSNEVATVLEFQLQHLSFQWTPRIDLLYDGLVGSPCNPRDSQESSPTPQFKSINFSALGFLHSLCCDSRGCKESDTTEQLNWTELKLCK